MPLTSLFSDANVDFGHPRSLMFLAASALFAAFVSLAAVKLAPPLRAAEMALEDLMLLSAYPRGGLSDEIAVVMINEDTLDLLPYRSPVDRAFLADLLEAVSAAGPKGVALDLIFDRPTTSDKDEKLFMALRVPRPHPVVAAYVDQSLPLTEKQRGFLETYLNGVTKGLAVLVSDADDGVVRQVKPAGVSEDGAVLNGTIHMGEIQPRSDQPARKDPPSTAAVGKPQGVKARSGAGS